MDTTETVVANRTEAVAAPSSSVMTDENTIVAKLVKLQARIKNTSSVRFGAARRIRFNYQLAQITVVILSLWAITISYILAMKWHQTGISEERLQAVGILLPVFIVAFSLIENGETYLKSHQLELSARQLRELSDQLYAEIARTGDRAKDQIKVFSQFSERYNDMLERNAVNHDDIDHWTRVCTVDRARSVRFSREWLYCSAAAFWFWCGRQSRRALYALLWISPAIFFYA